MDFLHSAFRLLHIALGTTAFIVAPVAMLTKKGGKHHRRWGLIYYWAMLFSVSISIVLSIYGQNLFLLGIGVFSFHLVFAGRRVLFMKRPDRGQIAQPIDYVVIAFAILTGAVVLIVGLQHASILGIAFGLGITGGLIPQLKGMITPSPHRHAWFFDHIGNMVGSYIAALTAFSVTNLTFLPMLVAWFWPTVAVVPILSYTIAKYRKKFEGGSAPEKVAVVQIALIEG